MEYFVEQNHPHIQAYYSHMPTYEHVGFLRPNSHAYVLLEPSTQEYEISLDFGLSFDHKKYYD